jgi:hypothetical protein
MTLSVSGDYLRLLQDTKAIWRQSVREEMRVWRNGGALMKGNNRNTLLKN